MLKIICNQLMVCALLSLIAGCEGLVKTSDSKEVSDKENIKKSSFILHLGATNGLHPFSSPILVSVK